MYFHIIVFAYQRHVEFFANLSPIQPEASAEITDAI